MKKVVLCFSSFLMSTCFGMDSSQLMTLEERRNNLQVQLDELNAMWQRMRDETIPISEKISKRKQKIEILKAKLNDLIKQIKQEEKAFNEKGIALGRGMNELANMIGICQADQKTIEDLLKLFPGDFSDQTDGEKPSSKQQIIALKKKYNELLAKQQLLIDWNQDLITFLSKGEIGKRFNQLNPNMHTDNSSETTAPSQSAPSFSVPPTMRLFEEQTLEEFISHQNASMQNSIPMQILLVPTDQVVQKFNRSLLSKLPQRMVLFLLFTNQLIATKLGPDIAEEFDNIFRKSILLNHPFESDKVISASMQTSHFSELRALQDIPIITSASDQTTFDIVSAVLLAAMSCKERDLIISFGEKLATRQKRGSSGLALSSLLNRSKYCAFGFKFLKEHSSEIISKNKQIKAPKELVSELLDFLIASNIKSSSQIGVDLAGEDPFFVPLSSVLTDLVSTMLIKSHEVAAEVVDSIPLPNDVVSPNACSYIAQQLYNKTFAHCFGFFIGRFPMPVVVDRTLLSFSAQPWRKAFKDLPSEAQFRKAKVSIEFPMPRIESIISPFLQWLPEVKELQKKLSLLAEIPTWEDDRLDLRKQANESQEKSVKQLEEDQARIGLEIKNLDKQSHELRNRIERLQEKNIKLSKQKATIENKYPNSVTFDNKSRYYSKQIANLDKQIKDLKEKAEKANLSKQIEELQEKAGK
ncbi:MAG: hypothetical protein IJA14_04390 [Alphaproteobacteria bacterium]|nr:hypothetical protein [Alphaproteobacteria bacterium]